MHLQATDQQPLMYVAQEQAYVGGGVIWILGSEWTWFSGYFLSVCPVIMMGEHVILIIPSASLCTFISCVAIQSSQLT